MMTSTILDHNSIELIKKLWAIMGSPISVTARITLRVINIGIVLLLFGYLAFVQYMVILKSNTLDEIPGLEIYSQILIFGIIPIIVLLQFYKNIYKKRIIKKVLLQFPGINKELLKDAIFDSCIRYK
jgi:hypothetical protein